MNHTLLLVQPRFSQMGHFPHFTLLNVRALSPYISLTALVYAAGSDDVQEGLLYQLSQIADIKVVREAQSGWRNSTWILYDHLLKIAKSRPELKHILFLDPQLMTLAAAIVLKPLPDHCQVIAPQVYGPEHHVEGSPIRVGLKRFLLWMASRYRRLRIAPFTKELVIAWRQSRVIPSYTCLELPTLQMVYTGMPTTKCPILDRAELVFVLVGQLRQSKNIDRLIPLFRGKYIPGQLHIAGPILEQTSELSKLITGDSDQIILDLRFLSEPELNGVVSGGHYNLLLYVDADERMEAGMLFTSVRLGTPVIGSHSGWLGRMIREYELGYAIDPYNVDEIRHCLLNCALPGSPEYSRFEQGIRRMLADYRQEVVVPKFLAALGIPFPEPDK